MWLNLLDLYRLTVSTSTLHYLSGQRTKYGPSSSSKVCRLSDRESHYVRKSAEAKFWKKCYYVCILSIDQTYSVRLRYCPSTCRGLIGKASVIIAVQPVCSRVRSYVPMVLIQTILEKWVRIWSEFSEKVRFFQILMSTFHDKPDKDAHIHPLLYKKSKMPKEGVPK